MSVSDNSTIAPSSDVDGSFQSLDELSKDRQPSDELSVAKKGRRVRRLPRSTAMTYGANSFDGSESLKEGRNEVNDGEEAQVQTERSPYADAEIVFLHVGSDATPFSVHGTILAKSAVLAAKYDPFSMLKQHVSIPEIDDATAHTVVHYLYTEKYDDLRASSQSTILAYKTGTCVYCAAVRYELPGLVDLAKEKVASLSDGVSISDILRISRDHAFPLLPDDETWYPSYLEDTVRCAMAKDPEPFGRPDFITQVEGNTRLLQVVWKTVMSNFASTLATPRAQDDASSSPTAEVFVTEVVPTAVPDFKNDDTPAVDVKEPKSKEQLEPDVSAHESPAEPSLAETVITSTTPEELFKLDDIEPTVDSNHGLESYTDELGFERSKTYQKMSKKDLAVEALASPQRERQPEHSRSDSVLQMETLIIPSKEETDKVEMVKNNGPTVATEETEANSVPKKNKNSKKKKKSSIVF